MSQQFDLIVLGCGGVGSAATYYATKRGLKVLSLEQFEPVHARGSSHGDTRVIRQAYFEHPDYVPLLQRAYTLWHELEKSVEAQLFFRTGLLEIGPESGVLIPGVRRAAALHHLPLEDIQRNEFHERFPGFHLPDGSVAVFEANAGFLLVERCIHHYIHESKRLGSDLRFNQHVISYEVNASGVRVVTAAEQFVAPKLIITAGAWASQFLSNINLKLHVLKKHLHWYPHSPSFYHLHRNAPTFFFETQDGYFYGFPSRDSRGVKVAQHSGGEAVNDPSNLDRSLDVRERAQVDRFLQAHLPQVTLPATGHAVCMYTMSPDEHFIVDQHPNHPQITFAAGLSGHGFKFASVLGELLVQLAIDNELQLPLEFLSLKRFSRSV